MKKALSTRLSIFLSVDRNSVHKYYNPHDPAPLYNRQLSQEFQEYLSNSIATARRNSSVRFKLICKNESDRKFVEPVLLSIRRHYETKHSLKKLEFYMFKKKNYTLLFFSFLLVLILQGIFPLIFAQDHRVHSGFSNALDVFSWVIMWKPIERLIFYWNPFLKDIMLLKKMETAQSIVIVNDKEYTVDISLSDAA
jgi:hypothetical protein